MSREFIGQELENSLKGIQYLLNNAQELTMADSTLKGPTKESICQYLGEAKKLVYTAYELKNKDEAEYKAKVWKELKERQEMRPNER